MQITNVATAAQFQANNTPSANNSAPAASASNGNKPDTQLPPSQTVNPVLQLSSASKPGEESTEGAAKQAGEAGSEGSRLDVFA